METPHELLIYAFSNNVSDIKWNCIDLMYTGKAWHPSRTTVQHTGQYIDSVHLATYSKGRTNTFVLTLLAWESTLPKHLDLQLVVVVVRSCCLKSKNSGRWAGDGQLIGKVLCDWRGACHENMRFTFTKWNSFNTWPFWGLSWLVAWSQILCRSARWNIFKNGSRCKG